MFIVEIPYQFGEDRTKNRNRANYFRWIHHISQ